jgi:hypothetical protein
MVASRSNPTLRAACSNRVSRLPDSALCDWPSRTVHENASQQSGARLRRTRLAITGNPCFVAVEAVCTPFAREPEELSVILYSERRTVEQRGARMRESNEAVPEMFRVQ